MKHFRFLSAIKKKSIFYKEPTLITKESPKPLLEYALGATLYMPAVRKDISSMILEQKYKEVCSMVMCLEDAIGDNEVQEAEETLIQNITIIHEGLIKGLITPESLPLIFIRVRNKEQMKDISNKIGESLQILAGFVFPKFTSENANGYLKLLTDISEKYNTTLYGMPILESSNVMYKETRMNELLTLQTALREYKDSILNIRIGATDLCGLYGIRRNSNTTIYDISIIRDFITDLNNILGRDFVISGPVWEYFENNSRILKPELRQTPFRSSYGNEGLKVRNRLLDEYSDGLIKESLLDIANGLNGKTVIHPSHVKIVQILHAVSHEEYLDALSIIEVNNGEIGVLKSTYSNKMNEIKPHLKWAEQIIKKSEVYGVYHENQTYIDILADQPQLAVHE